MTAPLTVDSVTALEERRCRAMEAADLSTLDGLFAEGLSYTHSNGSVDTKTSILASLGSGQLRYRSMHMSERTVTVTGSTAVVTGRARLEITAAGTDRTVHCRFTDVWAQDGDVTYFVAWQSTPLAPPAG